MPHQLTTPRNEAFAGCMRPPHLFVGQLASLVQDYVRDGPQGNAEVIAGITALAFANQRTFGN